MSLLSLGYVGVSRDNADQGTLLSRDSLPRNGRRVETPPRGNHPTKGLVQTHDTGDSGSESTGSAVPDAGGADVDGGVTSFGKLLVAQIPSEALLAYTTLLALFGAAGTSYKTGRWILYGASLVVCAAVVLSGYFAQRHTYDFVPQKQPESWFTRLHLPIFPTVVAVASMAVYGLTVPGSPLQYEVSGTAFGIWSGCLAVGGGVMMSILAPFLGRGNGAVTTRKQTAPKQTAPKST